MFVERMAGAGYGESWIRVKGGVSWAKQVAASVDPGAVGYQITAYQQAASQIAYAQKVLKNTQGNLDSSWTGDAATAAQQTFQGAINHAQLVQDTINQDIVPHLQTVQQAQRDFIDAMSSVPDEKPLTQEALLYEGTKSFMNYLSNYPGRVLVEHNTAARTQAAAALTKLTGTYSGSTTQLSALGDSGGIVSTTRTNVSTFNLGAVSATTNNGTAAKYQQNLHSTTSASGGRSNTPSSALPVRVTTAGGSTQLASSGPTGGNPPSDAPTLPSPIRNPVPAGSQPTEILPVGSQLPASGGYGGERGPIGEGEGERGGATGFGSGSSDGQTTGGTGTGRGTQRGTMEGNDGESLVETRNPTSAERLATGATEGEPGGGELLNEGVGSLGGLSAGSGVGRQSSRSSRYARGRYFDEPAEDEPSLPSVRSVFEDARDGQGNSLNLLSRRRGGDSDDEDGRGKRPSNPKEDGSWDSAQRIVPPVIE